MTSRRSSTRRQAHAQLLRAQHRPWPLENLPPSYRVSRHSGAGKTWRDPKSRSILKTRRLMRKLRTVDIEGLSRGEMKTLAEGTRLSNQFTEKNWQHVTKTKLKGFLSELKRNLPTLNENQNENEYNNDEYVARVAAEESNTPNSANSKQITPTSKAAIVSSRARRGNINTLKMFKYDTIIRNPSLFKKQWRGDSIFQDVIERKYGSIYGDIRPRVALTGRQGKLIDAGVNNKCEGTKVGIFNHEHGANAAGGKCCSLFENGMIAHNIGEGPKERTGKICGWVYSGKKHAI